MHNLKHKLFYLMSLSDNKVVQVTKVIVFTITYFTITVALAGGNIFILKRIPFDKGSIFFQSPGLLPTLWKIEGVFFTKPPFTRLIGTRKELSRYWVTLRSCRFHDSLEWCSVNFNSYNLLSTPEESNKVFILLPYFVGLFLYRFVNL